ncbi:MAG: cell division protein ZapB [Candidatus Berkiella sp.]
MTTDLFLQLEQKVEYAVDTIELLRLQIEELEEENLALKAEHEKWRSDLTSLINRLDQVDAQEATPSLDYESEDQSLEEETFVSA